MRLEAVQGVERILLFRRYAKRTEEDATRIALQTNHSASSSRDYETTTTKDGNVDSAGQIEQEISNDLMLSVGDDSVDELKEAHEKDELVELWDIDMNEGNKEDDKYKATYYQTKITEITEDAPDEGGVEIGLTYKVVGGIGQRGYTEVSKEQDELIQYVFAEATKAAESTD